MERQVIAYFLIISMIASAIGAIINLRYRQVDRQYAHRVPLNQAASITAG